MASFIKQPSSAAGAAKGTTRTLDISLDLSSAGQNGTGMSGDLRHRAGMTFSGRMALSAPVYTTLNGRQCVTVPSGLNYGFLVSIGLVVTTLRPAPGALTLRQGVTRICGSMVVTDHPASINSDVGMSAIIGNSAAAFTDLSTLNNVPPTSGGSGFGVMLSGGGSWVFRIKSPSTPQHTWTDEVVLDWPARAILDPVSVELRIYDATVSDEARLEVHLNESKILSRYWTNPPGITDPVLPPLDGYSGAQLFQLFRNTSTGPAYMTVLDQAIIQGPNDAGTL